MTKENNILDKRKAEEIEHTTSNAKIRKIDPPINELSEEELNRLLAQSINERDITTIHYLIEQGADTDTQDENENTALDIAIMLDDADLVEILAANDADFDYDQGLIKAIKIDSAEIVKLLISKNKVKLEDDEIYSESPLFIASHYNSLKVATLLIESGARINYEKYETKINEDNIIYDSPLHFAARNNSLEVARLLLTKNADVNSLDAGNKTPLHAAAENGAIDVAKLLLEYNASLNAIDSENLTPLDSVILHYRNELGRNCNANSTNTRKRSGQDLAQLEKASQTIKLFIENGSNIGGSSEEYQELGSTILDRLTRFHSKCSKKKPSECIANPLISYLIEQGASISESYYKRSVALLSNQIGLLEQQQNSGKPLSKNQIQFLQSYVNYIDLNAPSHINDASYVIARSLFEQHVVADITSILVNFYHKATHQAELELSKN